MNVLVFRDLPAAEQATLQDEFPACTFRFATDAASLNTGLTWPDAIFGNVPVDVAQRAPRLAWLQIVSSGFDEYRVLQATDVIVTTAHGVHAPIIAQHVLLMILLFIRGQLHFGAAQRRKIWDRQPAVPQRLDGQTIGLLGFGAVGRELARLVQPIDVRVLATKRTVAPNADADVELWPWSRLDELLAASDHLVITLPLTSATRRVLDGPRLSCCKPGAVVHNIARGDLIDESVLIERLRDGSLGGASLDVFEREPLPVDSPLWELPNVVMTPHIAGHHRELGRLVLERFKQNLRRRLRGEPLEHVANFARGY